MRQAEEVICPQRTYLLLLLRSASPDRRWVSEILHSIIENKFVSFPMEKDVRNLVEERKPYLIVHAVP